MFAPFFRPNKLLGLLFTLLLTTKTAQALDLPFGLHFDAPWSEAYKQKKLQKQQEKEVEPMVQTVDEWMERATDIKMQHREVEPYKEEVNARLLEKADWPVFFEKYNNRPGSREFNLEKLQANKNARSEGVISPNFKLMAYTECYYHPSSQQTSSAFFIYPLDTSKGKKQRVLEANVFGGAKKMPLISSSSEALKQFLFSSFTIVDWSKDNRAVLLKEKVGSSVEGIYQTYIWVYFLDEDSFEDDDFGSTFSALTAYGKRFDGLNEIVKQYWYSKNNLNLNHYRWDIKPLGFLANNENIVISNAYTYDEKNKEHIFLGSWSLDITTGEIAILSESAADSFEISTNGIVLIKRLP